MIEEVLMSNPAKYPPIVKRSISGNKNLAI